MQQVRRAVGSYLSFGRDVWLFLLYILLANIGYGVFTLIFNLYVYALGYREDAIGIFNSVQTFSVAITALILGLLMGRIGLWRTMLAGVTFYAVSDIGLALSSWAPALVVFSATEGAGLAVVITATMPFIIEFGRPAQRALTATIAFALASFSTTLGSLIGGYAPVVFSTLIVNIDEGSPAAYRAALLAGALLTLSGLAPLLRMSGVRGSHRSAPASSSNVTQEPIPERKRARMDVGVFMFVGLITALGTGLVSRFYNVFLQTLGASPQQIGLVYAAAGITAAVVGLAAPIAARRFGSLKAVLMIRGVALPFFLLLIVMPWYSVAVVAHIVRMVSVNMAWPVDSTFISELLPGKLRTAVFGWRSSMWNLGIGLSSIAGGWLIVQSGYAVTFAGYALCTALGISLYYVYFVRHPRVAAGVVPSALSSSERARRAVSQTEDVVGTVDGALPGTMSTTQTQGRAHSDGENREPPGGNL